MMKTFKDVYKMPLLFDSMDGWNSWVYDSDDNFVFQFEFGDKNKDFAEKIIATINGNYTPENKDMFYHKGGQIFFRNTVPASHVITIRGWGNLTGTGGMNLPHDVAANIQDTFAEHIVSILNNKQDEKKND